MIERYTAAVYDVPDRLFQVMRTSRTRTQLWLQADPAPAAGNPLRIEVHFDSVRYLCLPFMMRGLTVRAATPAEGERLAAAHGLELPGGKDMYLLSKEHDWFVVSGRPHWAESRLSYRDGPVFWEHVGDDEVVTSIGTLE